jgi:WD40 repeat protein
VSRSGDKTIQFWDAAAKVLLQTLEGYTSSVNSITFLPNNKQIVFGSYDKTMRFWDAATGVSLQTFEGYISSVYSVTFSPNGKQIVSRSGDEIV